MTQRKGIDHEFLSKEREREREREQQQGTKEEERKKERKKERRRVKFGKMLEQDKIY
jgi:hypothetical protein